MATVSVKDFAFKSFDKPDERRTPAKSQIDVLRAEGYTIGRFTFQPGWRWSECIKPVAKTDTCQLSHVGFVVSGRLTVQLASGKKQTISAGGLYTISPGHDAWVEGNEPFVGIEIMSAEQYAKR